MTATLAPVTSTDAPTVRVAQYLRVSLDKSGQGRSTDEQGTDNARAMADHARDGWALTATYRDDNRSASRYATREREEFARLLSDLDRGQFDILMLWESSRGSRRVSEWCRLIEVCQERHVLIYVTSHGRTYDPANSRDERTLLEDAVDSQYESGKVSTRVKRNAAANAAAGKPHGKIPYGYERVYDPHSKAFREQRPKPYEAAVVRYIFDALARGESMRAVANELNRRARLEPDHYGPQHIDAPTVTGVPWTPQVVRGLATSPTYIAVRTHHGTRTVGNWPALVDESTFYAVQRILTDPRRVTTKPGKAKYLLSMIATCGAVRADGAVCGNPMCVTFRTTANGRATYACKGANHLRIGKDDLDVYVTEWIIDYLEEHEDRLCAADTDDAEVAAARDEVARLKARLNEHYDAAATGQISARALAQIEPKIQAQIDDAEARVRASTTPPALRSLLTGPGTIAERWAAAPMPTKREVVRFLVSVTVLRSPTRGHRVDPEQRVAIEPKV
ncbi:recombinase family protein [Pseudonocardia tropica]